MITVEQQSKNPNFVKDGKLYLVKCHECHQENYALNVSSGCCTWCGWNQIDSDALKDIANEMSKKISSD